MSQTQQTCPLDRFRQFAADEREHYSSADGQRVVTSLHQVERYLQFLHIIKSRHQTANASVLASFERQVAEAQRAHVETRVLTAAELQELELDAHGHTVLHLEIESYFLFAKMVLDKIAQFLEDCALMITLRTAIADYRDKQIAYFKNSRAIHPTFISGGGKTQIGTLYTPAKETDHHVKSPIVDDVYCILDRVSLTDKDDNHAN